MKKQRKIISVLLALVMIMATGFIMSGCGEEDPIELFKKASDNMSKADAVSFDGAVNMTMKAEGQEMKMSIDLDGDYIAAEDPADIQMAMNMKMDMLGQSTEMHTYIKDGYTYTDDGTNKTKTETPKDSPEKMKQLMETKLEMDKYVKESSIDGDVVKMTLDGKKLMADAMDKYKDALGGDDTGNATIDSYAEMIEKAGIDEIKVEATIKDENFTAFKMTMPMKIDLGTGSKVDTDVDLDFSKLEINPDLKEIEIPDIDSFK